MPVALSDKLRQKPRILFYDIETSPHLVYAYDLYKPVIRPDQIVEPSRLLCWAGKWMGSRRVFCFDERDRPEMLQALWDALNEADIVVGYNHAGFDNKHVRRELALAGFPPPSPWQDVDLLRENRRLFKFASNRLGYVTDCLDLPTKLTTSPGLWRRVLEGDDRAWRDFRKYNKQDVVATEALARFLWKFLRLPHVGLWSDDLVSCPSCGGRVLEPAGKAYTKTAVYPRLLCSCGAWSKVLANGTTRLI